MELSSTSSGGDRELADRFRVEHSEQFTTLVRMHLSFLLELDLSTEEYEDELNDHYILESGEKGKTSKKMLTFSKKTKGSLTGSTSKGFGGSCPSPAKNNVKKLTFNCVEQLRKLMNFLELDENIVQEGIFRRTGAVSRQNELKTCLMQDKDINIKDGGYSVHDCATVLKGFLADLPEPLMTDKYNQVYKQIAGMCNGCSPLRDGKMERVLNAVQLILMLLPNENRILLEEIILMLYKIQQHKTENKMTADNLSTLFTPHLICPRKLSAEEFASETQMFVSVISFMISKGNQVFDVPSTLATDIRAYSIGEERRKTMSPEQVLNESISSDSTANTVFTFVDRQKTAEAHSTNPTDTALAQLYAHIQSLPESSKKRKLIKQFNKENGQGTPLHFVMMNRMKNNNGSSQKGGMSLGDSIKKHIFSKNIVSRTPKRSLMVPSTITSCLSTPNRNKTKQTSPRVLFQTPITRVNVGETVTPINKPITQSDCQRSQLNITNNKIDEHSTLNIGPTVSVNLKNGHNAEVKNEICQMSTNNDFFLKDGMKLKELYRSEPNLSALNHACMIENKTPLVNHPKKAASLNNLRLLSKLPLIEKHQKLPLVTIANNKIPHENLRFSNCAWNETLNYHDNQIERHSMSPITKSAQGIPKAMQDSIMTPRSRKPVILFGVALGGGSNSSNGFSCVAEEEEDKLLDSEELPELTNSWQPKNLNKSLSESDLNLDEEDIECKRILKACGIINNPNEDKPRCPSAPETLTDNFRDYLHTRDVVYTDNPEDSSFASQSDDFASTYEIEDISESEMSESLLCCMNGKEPIVTDNELSEMKENILQPNKRFASDNCESSSSLENIQQCRKRVLLNNVVLGETSL